MLLFLKRIDILECNNILLMFRYILLIIISLFFSVQNIGLWYSADDLNLRETIVKNGSVDNPLLKDFVNQVSDIFFSPPSLWWDWMQQTFFVIAFQIKNFFIMIAVLFLVLWVLKLLFSPWGDEDIKKWRRNIVWVTVGIFIMQISYSVWSALNVSLLWGIDWSFWESLWEKIFQPIVKLLQMLAAFGFISMMIYAFYIIVTGWGDEEKLKKWKTTVIYAIVWFLLIKVPEYLVNAIYWKVYCSGVICEPDLAQWIGIIAKIFNFFNGFLAILCVILIIYAGWLVLISWGDEEKLKKAKNIILYIVIGLLLLVGSHALFRFFILQDV